MMLARVGKSWKELETLRKITARVSNRVWQEQGKSWKEIKHEMSCDCLKERGANASHSLLLVTKFWLTCGSLAQR